MDTNLFQVLTLALLFLSLLAILAAISVLSGIKKRLEEGPAPSSAGLPSGSSHDYQAPVATSYQAASTYEPVSTTYEPTVSPTQVVSASHSQEVETSFVPLSEATPSTASAPSETLTGGLRGDEPEEQPFERDGRWWFKRGDELLVYDEGTGQWVAAPSAGSIGTPDTATAAATYAPGATEVQTATQRVDTGEGWKCSSCGAVNGSTATTCRMCFAPR